MPGGPIYGEGFIDLSPQLSSGFATGLGAGFGGIASKIGAALKTPIGAAITIGVVGAVAALNLGGEFDKAFDTIRVGTGAIGDDLDDLQSDFKAVFSSIPADMDPVATAIADINTRLGLTGVPLQEMARQFVELARITDSDVAGSIESVTRVFGDWSIATENQGDQLDYLFRVSQATGPSVEQISRNLVAYGAPLRQIGFGFEQSAALIAKFEKEGVNAELVLGSLRIALGQMARTGEDAPETFARVVESIENAGSVSEANALALELFGARAGPDMAASIREGRFELGTFVDDIEGSSETILSAAKDTNSWQQSWKVFTNNLKVFVEPVATAVFKGLGGAMEWLVSVVDVIKEALNDPNSGLSKAFATVGEVFTAVGAIIGGIVETISVLWAQFGDEIVAVIAFAFESISNVVKPLLDAVKAIIDTVVAVISGDWKRAWQGIKDFFVGIWESFAAYVDYIWTVITIAISAPFVAIRLAWDTFWNGISSFFEGIWNGLKSFAAPILQWIEDRIDDLMGFLRGLKNFFLDVRDAIGLGGIDFEAKGFPVGQNHRGILASDETLSIIQRGELLIPRGQTNRLLGFLDEMIDTDLEAGGGGDGSVFDGATLVFQGSPAELVANVGRRVGLEKRLATT